MFVHIIVIYFEIFDFFSTPDQTKNAQATSKHMYLRTINILTINLVFLWIFNFNVWYTKKKKKKIIQKNVKIILNNHMIS